MRRPRAATLVSSIPTRHGKQINLTCKPTFSLMATSTQIVDQGRNVKQRLIWWNQSEFCFISAFLCLIPIQLYSRLIQSVNHTKKWRKIIFHKSTICYGNNVKCLNWNLRQGRKIPLQTLSELRITRYLFERWLDILDMFQIEYLFL